MTSSKLALFDLDNTLLSADSDIEWPNFLIDEGVVDRQIEQAANADFVRRYRDGSVGTLEIIRFYLRLLIPYEMELLLEHSVAEFRFITFGVSARGRLLSVSHAEHGNSIRIISARLATRAERKIYEET